MKKKFLISLCAIPLFCGVACVRYDNVNVVKAEELSSSEPTSQDSSEPTSDYDPYEEGEELIDKGEEALKDLKEKLQNWKDTYLVPILSGVSLASILSAVVSITLAVLNRRTNGKMKENTDNTCTIAKSVADNANKVLEVCKTMQDEVEKDRKVSLDTINTFKQQTDVLLTQIADLTGKTENLMILKAEILKIAQVLGSIVSHIETLRNGGCAEEIQKMIEELKALK